MDDESSCEEDFSESLMFAEVEPTPKKIMKKDVNAFEILSIEKLVENIFEMVATVQSCIAVSVCDENFL